MLVREGDVDVEVPEQADAGVGEGVFFNPRMELNRDVTVAALRAYRDREPRAATYLDATAASGVRGVRAAAEGWETTMADVSEDAVALCRENVERNDLDAEVVRRDANSLLHDADRVFDVVDLDPFGTPVPFADAAFANARNLVCVTATDTAPLCGAHFESGVRSYSAVPRNTEYHAEMGLRILLGALARTAARYDAGVRPILSHVSDHYVRTYLELDHGATPANDAVDELGHLAHCPECLWRATDPGLIADLPDDCPVCGGDNVVHAGPLWLGPAHDADFVAATRAALSPEMGAASRADSLLDRIGDEIHEPTHYDQHRLAKRWGITAGPMDEFLAGLREAGHAASRSHFGGTTFKTDADVTGIEAATAD